MNSDGREDECFCGRAECSCDSSSSFGGISSMSSRSSLNSRPWLMPRKERVPRKIDEARICIVTEKLIQRIERTVCAQLGFAVQGLQGKQSLGMIVDMVRKERSDMMVQLYDDLLSCDGVIAHVYPVICLRHGCESLFHALHHIVTDIMYASLSIQFCS